MVTATAKKSDLKNPWMWLVAGPLVFVVCVCAVLVTMAVKYGDDVVSDDYYKEGKLVNHRFAAERYAKSAGIVGELELHAGSRRFVFQLNEPRDSSEVVLLKLSHPVNANKDQTFTLSRQSLTGYIAGLPDIPEGRWYVRVEGFEDNNSEHPLWRLSGEVNFSNVTVMPLQ